MPSAGGSFLIDAATASAWRISRSTFPPASLARFWSDQNLAKLAGGNILRVLRQAEAVSRSMAGEPPAADPLTPDYQ